MLRMARESWVVALSHSPVRLQEAGALDGGGLMRVHADGQRAQSPHQQPGFKRPDVPAQDGVFVMDNLIDNLLTRYERSGNDVAVPREVLGRGMHDDIDPQLNRTLEDGRRPGV